MPRGFVMPKGDLGTQTPDVPPLPASSPGSGTPLGSAVPSQPCVSTVTHCCVTNIFITTPKHSTTQDAKKKMIPVRASTPSECCSLTLGGLLGKKGSWRLHGQAHSRQAWPDPSCQRQKPKPCFADLQQLRTRELLPTGFSCSGCSCICGLPFPSTKPLF